MYAVPVFHVVPNSAATICPDVGLPARNVLSIKLLLFQLCAKENELSNTTVVMKIQLRNCSADLVFFIVR